MNWAWLGENTAAPLLWERTRRSPSERLGESLGVEESRPTEREAPLRNSGLEIPPQILEARQKKPKHLCLEETPFGIWRPFGF